MRARKTIPAGEITAALQRLAREIAERRRDSTNLVLLGIARGGVPVNRRLVRAVAGMLKRAPLEGVINVSFHRDDLGRKPIPDFSMATSIPGDLEAADVVLVDDVLFTGRTARAALEEVFSHGRPARVELAVLVDRGNRCLPIAADYTGIVEPTTRDERVRVELDEHNPAADRVIITTGTSSPTDA